MVVYPGSFDPITNGHISILRRTLTIFDSVNVAVAENPMKNTLFSLEERLAMIRESIKNDNNVYVDSFDGLLVDYVESKNTNVIIRGMRALSDFEYEFQMSLMNRKLNNKIQTIFMMTDYKWFYTSSTIIKEAARYGGAIRGLVPDIVCQKLKEKFDHQ
ncbi:MAG: pantetheine-phosphate adenylyltransferase [Deltaproteobacteria bacterium]|nr:pantetheine-phosphate adenylyltransferase [Deltaproteobacteria bacterium]MBW2075953.1 pantetheine-phosphate adenylyltransferase [Deltaproteobacteria bacterium]MBW2309962.1 pantetheine-phosphate adenylyltransferase [Deltaproteobacteria bacterium]RLB27852.1 MAG: pantetheine-phosphate adenylyltransferase [Deltaproteobacteria bacterium]